jgi:hypothetical protein
MQNFVCTSPDLKDACDAAGAGVVDAASADRRDPPALRPDRKRLVCDPCSHYRLLSDRLTDCRPVRAPMNLLGNCMETSVSGSKQRVHCGCEPWFVYSTRPRSGCIDLMLVQLPSCSRLSSVYAFVYYYLALPGHSSCLGAAMRLTTRQIVLLNYC